jgi:integrase
MASARARHGSYLFQRPGSANWHIKLRSPGKRTEISLGTPDKLAAEIKAAPLLAAHKAALLAARPRLAAVWTPALEPGREHAAPDGGKIVATEKELIHIGHNGAILKIEPNGHASMQIVGDGVLSAREEFAAFDGGVVGTVGARRTVATKGSDDALIESYISHANLDHEGQRETRAEWQLFRSLCSKPLKDCDRDDGRLLVAHHMDKGNKSASMKKSIGRLRSAVNFAIKEKKLQFNPFAGIVPKLDDADKRIKLDDADMVAVRAKIDALDDAGEPYLSEADRLLLRLVGSTGMRLSEAFQIDGEQNEDGARFVIVGTKTASSLRRVPLPATLDGLPTIKGALFAAGRANRFAAETIKRLANDTSKRLMKFLRNDCGITDPNKVVHSLRHRAQDQLRRAACPKDIRQELLGHDTKTVGEGYGEGHPVPMLKEWIDRIGF